MREAGRFLLTVVMLIFVGGVALIFLLLTALANVAYSRPQVQAEKGTRSTLVRREGSPGGTA